MRNLASCLTALLMVSMMALMNVALGAASEEELRQFSARVAKQHKLDEQWIRKTLGQAKLKQAVRNAYKRTAESKPWSEYRPIFVTKKRARAGHRFWRKHDADMRRAEEKYGVPAAIIAAIIGVETFYGTYMGKYRVLDSLYSLAFYKWKRQKFFTRELEQFLVLSAEGHVDPLTVKGSYAGAMGLPQFISSSYRAYSVDFDADGKRNLLTSESDAIGSVAAYLKRHGWRRGAPVAAPTAVTGAYKVAPYKRNKKPKVGIGKLHAAGVKAFPKLPAKTPAMVVRLRGSAGREDWVALKNFYVITRYNHSSLYAMAVYQLAEMIAELRGKDA